MSDPPLAELSFPRRSARTARFTLGAPRALTVSGDGQRVVFLRSASGTDRADALWVLDVPAGHERRVADPDVLLGGLPGELPPEELARRERLRESGTGITAFATDDATTVAAFALGGRLYGADLVGDGGAAPLATPAGVVDPRPSPDGRWVAYHQGGGLRLVSGLAGADGADRALVEPDGDLVTWGIAEFAAAEELDRHRGFWWSPGSDGLLVARVDESPVAVWWIADPAHPEVEPRPHRYPAAGTANADVTLWWVPLDHDERREVRWDRDGFEYLVAVHWSDRGAPLLLVSDRAQSTMRVLAVDVATGTTELVRTLHDDAWVDVVPGTPAWGPHGSLVTVEAAGDRSALHVDGAAVSPEGVQVRAVVASGPADVHVVGTEEPGHQHLYRWSPADGFVRVSSGPGVHAGAAGGDTVALVSSLPGTTRRAFPVVRGDQRLDLVSHADDPGVATRWRMIGAGPRGIRTAVVLPREWQPGDGALPVLMDPYGGPHAQRVWDADRAYLESQWWADQGFAVVVADGRGTPGTPSWERSVRLDLTTGVLQDQVDALQAVAEALPDAVDLSRVGIRGWSFGGYLAALAVLRRPDVFHAAVAGAPVTDWRLYDTAYTERYLGLPQERPEVYEAGSLLPLAGELARPLLVIHGLADDNVVVAHSLQLSAALLAAGRPHAVVPLSGITHMASDEVVAENLLLLQLDFLRAALHRP